MSDLRKSIVPSEADRGGRVAKPEESGESVFDNPSPAPEKEPAQHDGEHGQNGRENDLDRAEDAGREGGRR